MDSSSSDGSFAWTDASDDTIDSGAMFNDNINKTHSEDESVSGKSYKKKLQEELFAESNGAVKCEEQVKQKRKLVEDEEQTQSEHVSPKKRKIKTEPVSDIDVSEMKINTLNRSEPRDSYYETYLDIKVKAEQEFATPSLGKIKKHKSKHISDSGNLQNELCETENKPHRKNKSHSCEETDIEKNQLNKFAQDENENYEKKRKKKKKESKTRNNSLMSDETTHEGSHMEVSETIESSSGSSTHYTEIPKANVTGQLDFVEPDIIVCTKNKNNSFGEQENSTNGETKHQQDLSVYKNVSLNVHNTSATRTPKISERIQFEEDESSEMESSLLQGGTSIQSSKLKRYLKNNSNLKCLTSKLRTESVITVDDDIWIVRCPKDVDVDAFQSKHLTLEGKCKLKLNGQTYEGTVDNEGENMSILSAEQSEFIIKCLSVKGFLNLRKRIPKCHLRDEVMATYNKQANFIPLPETKCRHPLLGSNYRKAIKLPAAVVERLQAPPTLTKRSHKVDHSLSTPKTEPELESSVKPEGEVDQPVSCKKKKKKRKHMDSEEIAPKKKRRLKHNLESAEAWESEQAIEENLFNF